MDVHKSLTFIIEPLSYNGSFIYQNHRKNGMQRIHLVKVNSRKL